MPNIFNHSHGNMSLLKSSNPSIVGLEKCNIAEAQTRTSKYEYVWRSEEMKKNPLQKRMKTQADSGMKGRNQFKTCKQK